MDRLTVEEGRAAAAHTLEVVYGLDENMREVISGEKKAHFVSHVLVTKYSPRSTGVHPRHSK